MAASGHLPISDLSTRPATGDRVWRAWGAGGEDAVGGALEPVHSANGTAGDWRQLSADKHLSGPGNRSDESSRGPVNLMPTKGGGYRELRPHTF